MFQGLGQSRGSSPLLSVHEMNSHVCVSVQVPSTAVLVVVDSFYFGKVSDSAYDPNAIINNHFFALSRSDVDVHRL